MTNELQDKVVVVTGASSGFGRGIAKACADAGAAVVVVVSDIHEEPNAGGFEEDSDLATAQAIQKAGGRAVFVKADVAQAGDMANVVAEAVRTYGRLDVMVNNAGVYGAGKRIHEWTEEELERCWSINAKGSFFGAQEAVKQFLTQGQGGNIINMVSTAGLQGHPSQAVYNMSKGAQAQLTRCLAIEYGADGIRVNGICPTYAKTSLTRTLVDDQAFLDAFSESIPLKRWGEVSDVTGLAVFLASDASSYIHGDLIRVDGGETLCRYSVLT